MFCAENFWTFSEDRGHLTQMVKELIEERMDFDMEPKPESLLWTSTFEEEVREDIWKGSGGETWRMPFVEEFELLGYRCLPDGKVIQFPEKSGAKGRAAGEGMLTFVRQGASCCKPNVNRW